jgi:hypothetical protein
MSLGIMVHEAEWCVVLEAEGLIEEAVRRPDWVWYFYGTAGRIDGP